MAYGKAIYLDMLSRFGMTGCKPITSPLEVNGKLTQDGGELIDDVTMYRSMVGSLIYMTMTRPKTSVMQLGWLVSSCRLHGSPIWIQSDGSCDFSMACFMLLIVICICLAIQMLIGLGALMT